jgi:hypothetical protein
MGLAIETVFGSMDAAAATGLQPYVPANGQTFQVRACNGPTPAHLETLWGSVTDPGFARIRSPRMHDDVNGVQAFVQATDPSPVIDEYFENTLFSQDFLTVEGLFLAAPTIHDINQIAFNVYYDDIPGLAANFLPWAQVKSLMDSAPVRNQYSGVYVEPITNATVGQFGVGVALNSSQDVWKANSLYALIGYEVDQEFTGFTLQGTDLGNLQFGGPGSLDPKITRSWFVDQEMKTGRPSIPVINSQNKQSTLVSAFGATATTTVTVNLVFAYCGPASVS